MELTQEQRGNLEKPEAGMWGVLESHGFPAVEITRVSDQCFWFRGVRYRGEREIRAYLEKLACWSTDRAAAEKASARLISAQAEHDRRVTAARLWLQSEKAKIEGKARASLPEKGE